MREREDTEKAHEVSQVAARMTAEEARRLTRARETEVKVAEAALRQEADRVARVMQEQEANRNLEVAVLTLRGALSDEERKAGCEAVEKAHEEVKRLESEVPTSPQVVVAGVWQDAGGVVRRQVEVVVRLKGPVGRERTTGLKGVVEQVQALARERKHASWDVTAVVWMEHAADEVLWRVTGVEKETSDEMVMKDLLDDVTAVVGSGLVQDSWVEDRRSRYVVVKSIPEAELVKDWLSKLKGGAGEGGWGHRAPVVVGRIRKPWAERVSVKVEVLSGEVAAALVKNGTVILGLRKVVELAVREGGARVPRPGEMGTPSVSGCVGCKDRGHVQRFCPTMARGGLYGGVAGRCWGCGGQGHRISVCLECALPMADPDGTFPLLQMGGQ